MVKQSHNTTKKSHLDTFVSSKVESIYSAVQDTPEFTEYDEELINKLGEVGKLLPADTKVVVEVVDIVSKMLDFHRRFFFGYGFVEGIEVPDNIKAGVKKLCYESMK